MNSYEEALEKYKNNIAYEVYLHDNSSFEVEFSEKQALIELLTHDVVFLNTHWWELEWPDDAKQTVSLNVEVSDVFLWGLSDAEELLYSEIKELYDYWYVDVIWGSAIWVIKKRNYMPQKPVYDAIMEKGIWNLDCMNLRPNKECLFWKRYNEN